MLRLSLLVGVGGAALEGMGLSSGYQSRWGLEETPSLGLSASSCVASWVSLMGPQKAASTVPGCSG